MDEDTARYGPDSRNQAKNPEIFVVDEVAGTTHWDLNTTPTETNAPHGHSTGTNMDMETRRVEGTTVIEGAQSTWSTMDIDPPRPAVVTDNNYSDLPEVVEAIPPSWDLNDDKMPVIVDEASEKIAAMDGQIPASMLSPSLTDPVPAYPHSLRFRSSNLSTVPLVANDRSVPSSPYYDQMQIQDEESRDVKVCGMGSRVFMCVAIGLLVFVLVLLATVLGVTLTMKGQKSSSSSASHDILTILNTTQLASVNWTDTTGVARSALFYQESDSSILVSLRDSVSNKWYYSNVTQAVLNMTGADTLDVLAGTPLAAVTNSYQVSLYYMTNDHFVSEIWASDIIGETWFAGELGTRLAPQAMEGSKLSAYWQICENCTNSLFLTYQEPSGSIQLCNLTNNTWSFSGPIGTELSTNGTGLALRPFTDNDGTGKYGTIDNALRVYHFGTSGKLLEIMQGPETNFTWVDGSSGRFTPREQTGLNRELTFPSRRLIQQCRSNDQPQPGPGIRLIRRPRVDEHDRGVPRIRRHADVQLLERERLGERHAQTQRRAARVDQLHGDSHGAEPYDIRVVGRGHLRVPLRRQQPA